MAIGLPQIIINFQGLAASAIQRSARGIVAMILLDDTVPGTVFYDYKLSTDIDPDDWSDDNLAYLKMCFEGLPTKVIVYRLATTATALTAAVNFLKTKRWNYIVMPEATSAFAADIVTYVKAQRALYKTFKAVVAATTAPDHEGIINFQTDNVKVGICGYAPAGDTYDKAEFCVRIAGILAGLSLELSSTFKAISEVESADAESDFDASINAGKLVLYDEGDGNGYKIARGVNSLTTFTATKTESFRKIKIIEALDLIRDDIRDTFKNSYVGKYNNDYDNKILLIAAINVYFNQLKNQFVLDRSADAYAEIDIEAHKDVITLAGKDPADYSDQQIKEWNTGDDVFLVGKCKPVDSMEDLYFDVTI